MILSYNASSGNTANVGGLPLCVLRAIGGLPYISSGNTRTVVRQLEKTLGVKSYLNGLK